MFALRSSAVILLLVAGGTAARARAQGTRVSLAEADSVVLERTLCYGTCPAYRLSVTRAGHLSFASRNRGDSSRTEYDSVSSAQFAALLALADRAGLATLPDTIAKDRTLCPDRATDHPTAIVTIFNGAHRQTVVDYRGCFAAVDHSVVPAVQRLRDFEAQIDSVSGSARWVRPAGRQ